MRVEHWINAQDTGSYAAFNMMGKLIPYGNTPVFWSRNYNKTLQYIGYCEKYDDLLIDGSVRDHKWIGYYMDGDRVCGIGAQGRYKDMLTMFEAMNSNQMPSAGEIKSGKATPATIRDSFKVTGANKGCVNCRCRKMKEM